MVVINEFLPNPVGKDADGEFIELFNNSQNEISLAGWKIKDASGKTFVLSQKIPAGGYSVLNYKTTKISLNNDAETIFLYDSVGNLINKAGFSSGSVEGKSYSRKDSGEFAFASPTSAKANLPAEASAQAGVFENSGKSLAANAISKTSFNDLSGGGKIAAHSGNLFAGFFIALILAFLSVIIIKKLNLFQD